MKWLIYGILASIFSGLWGLFNKLSSNVDPFISNIIIYLSALFFAILMLATSKKFSFSKYSFLAGLFAGIGNFFVLYSLVQNKLILVLPFVSASAIIFFLMVYLIEKPIYTTKQKTIAAFGIIISLAGILTVCTGSVGFFNFINELTLDKTYLMLAILTSVCFGLWTYFTYKSVQKERISAAAYNFWQILASLITALIAALLLNKETFSNILTISPDYIFPVLSGLSILLATFFVYKAFSTTTAKNKLQDAIVAILSNGELIPLPFISYFVLKEYVPEGFIGAFIILIGLFAIHYAEASK